MFCCLLVEELAGVVAGFAGQCPACPCRADEVLGPGDGEDPLFAGGVAIVTNAAKPHRRQRQPAALILLKQCFDRGGFGVVLLF